ncbi:MAG TPA: branched-chain amino acid ABC transporter permease [Pyrinomonadaceae bacterium]|jgi:branched-chain amino acid transport system permease protein
MLLEQLLNGIGIGCTYALIALGFSLQFSVLRIVNLAFGEVFMASAFAALLCTQHISTNPLLVASTAIGASILIGLMVHFLAVRPLGNVASVDSPRHLSVIISTSGCSLILHNLVLKYFGANPIAFQRLVPDWSFQIGESSVKATLLLNFGVTVIVMFALLIWLKRSFIGLRIRAVAENKELATATGIRAGYDETIAVLISSALAGLAAVLISQVVGSISHNTGLSYGLKGLIILIVAGAGNFVGAVITAMFLGVSETFAAYFSSSYRDAVAFSLLLLLLVGREFTRAQVPRFTEVFRTLVRIFRTLIKSS